MNRLLFAALAATALVAPVVAQTANPYDGKWTISYEGKKLADIEGSIVIQGEGREASMTRQQRFD